MAAGNSVVWSSQLHRCALSLLCYSEKGPIHGSARVGSQWRSLWRFVTESTSMEWFLLSFASENLFSIFIIMLLDHCCVYCAFIQTLVFWWFMTISVTHVTVLLRSPNLEPSVPYHYYEPAGPDECKMYLSHEQGRYGSHHRFITEKRVFANWALMFNIHFYQPDWRPAPVTKNSTDSWGSDTGVFLGLRTSVSFWGQNLNIWTGTHYEWKFWNNKV